MENNKRNEPKSFQAAKKNQSYGMKQSTLTFLKALGAQLFWKFKSEMKMSPVMKCAVLAESTFNIVDFSQDKEFLHLIVLGSLEKSNLKSRENLTSKAFFNDPFILYLIVTVFTHIFYQLYIK